MLRKRAVVGVGAEMARLALRAGQGWKYGVAATAALMMAPAAMGDPALPTIPSGTFTVSAATGNAATDTASLASALTQAKNAGGGTVLVPSGTYLSNALTLSSGINLQLSAGAVIQNNAPSSTLITAASNAHDVAITGTGTIDGHATATSSSNLVSILNVSRLLISGVTIANASHEHLVIEGDNNVTVDGVKINDNFSVAQTGDYLANTDGIDFSGSHFLIKNTTVNAGDDDIVAKPGNTFTSDIAITNDTIGAGHGISIGGQTNKGLNGMSVSNITFSGTDNGLRMKAGTGQGGTVQNVSFSNITMTNVATPIIINSWYQSGDKYGSRQLSPSSLHTLNNPNETAVPVDQGNNATALNAFFDNITYSNITATGATQNVAVLYGLDSISSNTAYPRRNIDDVAFSNVTLSGAYGADIYYVSNVDTSGLTVHATSGPAMNLYGDGPLGDVTGDGTVDVNDLNVVLNHLGAAATGSMAGNFDGTATVDLHDLNTVLNNLGASAPVVAEAALEGLQVPEPATAGWLASGAVLIRRQRTRLRR